MTRTRAFHVAAIGLAAATTLWFLGSRLALVPVPWPDATAYFTSGLELLSWPPSWRMHAQAAFVPTYDLANFNIPPGLPFVFAAAHRLGLTSVLGGAHDSAHEMMRVLSMTAFFAFLGTLWVWVFESLRIRVRPLEALALSAAVFLAALWDPTVRWGSMAVRTEIWVGLMGLLTLRELTRAMPSARKLGAYLALGAWFHYSAVVFVPVVVVGSWRGRDQIRAWIAECFRIAGWTLVFFSPWVLYALLHWSLFWEQMDIQFNRLAHGNLFIRTPYLFFHNMFLTAGSPVGQPKFYSLGKGLFFLLWFLLGFRLAAATLRREPALRLHWAAAVAFAISLAMWCDKPEIWFVTPCHLTLWTWVAASLIQAPQARLNRWIAGFSGAYAIVALLATVSEQVKTPEIYDWSNYHQWISCVDQVIHTAPAASEPELGRGLRVWQPHVPDTLSELLLLDPRLDVTRSLDFPGLQDHAWANVARMDAVIFSAYFVPPVDALVPYQGPPRPHDLEVLSNEQATPFGPRAVSSLETDDPGQFRTEVCSFGPFWATIAVRK